ncbi:MULTISPECIES: hypothetical protein [unclassified Rhodococcus (in: high G+C Gram-positive bacteria)]|uniref:hypothetical protein n=1 Tax=unclassified Rhodococcus (in: high G+C Gram-positive bacteria) TaxID=192944 RepID=UPI0006FAD4D9|nr:MULTISPECIES: hypothetical protein [unclassified Rhodococcus (in: high G+C Gram-positive bacteria)]KQU30329.1 hypothetical protein ASG69_04540 [Rhodococcus sp. Leaf225]KQU44766.1 hypothetical protein ASH03_12600 [Rhodococcus sp. Leaf258]
MPAATRADERTGHGRWTILPLGTLWTTDTGVVGWQPIPNADPAPIQTLIDNALAAGKDGNTAFDEIALVLGSTRNYSGDLDNYRPDRTPTVLPPAR